MEWQDAKKIMGKKFIGPDELSLIASEFIGAPASVIPKVHYDANVLKKAAQDYLLILGVTKTKDGKPLTINNMRAYFGFDPAKSEPCFYNQDWYLKEKFANTTTLKSRWYLIRKSVIRETRGIRPDIIGGKLKKGEQFPSAVLTAFTFFVYYFLHDGAMLWNHDFIWCSDKDKNGDRIYTGRYSDPKKINKNGFNVHRHLSIRSVYGATIVRD